MVVRRRLIPNQASATSCCAENDWPGKRLKGVLKNTGGGLTRFSAGLMRFSVGLMRIDGGQTRNANG